MNCVAFSPDRTLVAVADTTGQIKIASLTMRRVEMRLQSDVTEIQSLAFGRNIHPVDAEIPNKTIADWQLAAGDSGGTVTIWDLDRGIPRTYCRGAYYNIFAVAFSPDGTLLASAGRHLAKIWNATTGQHLLDVVSQDFTYGLAFSSDGRRLALGNRFVSGVQIVSLENGRAVRALRGLSSQVARVIFSGDGRQIAALSQDNKLAIWDLESGLLKHRVDIPQGMYADNAGLAFSPDGLRFAAALGGDNSGAARLWDLVTGKTIKTWPLRPGKQDTLQFHPSGQLLSCRCEYREGRRREFGIVARDNPCLCRLYNLTSETPLEPVAEFDEFDVDINAIVAPQAGSWFLVVGRSGVNGERIVNRVIDGLTGKVLGEIPATRTGEWNPFFPVDPTGKVVVFSTSNNPHEFAIVELPSVRTIKILDCQPWGPFAVGPEARMLSTHLPNPDRYSIRTAEGQHLTTIGLYSHLYSSLPAFSVDGTRFAWGNAEGVVFIADLPTIRRRLAESNLAW